ncbi:MAG: hypothetical protein IT579_16085 [Verrucomicrobia subdivision 3 bacterium]|nr:hypothetical protein [Limisphaerales bacterium]
MNLQWKHLPLILLGGLVGAGLGWLGSFLFGLGGPNGLASLLGLHAVGMLFGSIGGLGFAVVTIVTRAARNPKVGPARYFMQINGTGSMLLGEAERRVDGSYVTTEWFTILFFPVFPVCRYRVTRHPGATPFHTLYTIHEKLPVLRQDAKRGYGIGALFLLGFLALAYAVAKDGH